MSDATVLIRDMAGDAAQKAASKVNPSEDELNQIDEPAEDNTWHDVPDLSKDNLKSQAKSKYNEQKPFSRSDAKNALGDATQAAHPTGSRDPTDAAELAYRDQQQGGNSGMDAQHGARQGASNLRDQARQNIPDETQDKAREGRDRTKGYLKDKIPEERRDQTIYRLKKMIVEIQGHQDCEQHRAYVVFLQLTFFRPTSHRHPTSPGRGIHWPQQEPCQPDDWHCQRCPH